MVAKFGVQAQHLAVARIQRAWLRRARNRWLEARVGRVFAIARAGDVDAMMRELRAHPDVLFMRDRWGRGWRRFLRGGEGGTVGLGWGGWCFSHLV